jgi:hypothetical protein
MVTDHPPGEYAIIELFGHTTLVGRIAEVERFGTKMLAIEPLFDDTLLGVVFHGGAAIYRLTPCSAAVAYARQPRQGYQLPPSIRAILPDALLESSSIEPDDDDYGGGIDGEDRP